MLTTGGFPAQEETRERDFSGTCAARASTHSGTSPMEREKEKGDSKKEGKEQCPPKDDGVKQHHPQGRRETTTSHDLALFDLTLI